MTLWFVLLLLMFRSDACESRLLHAEQLRGAEGLSQDVDIGSTTGFSSQSSPSAPSEGNHLIVEERENIQASWRSGGRAQSTPSENHPTVEDKRNRAPPPFHFENPLIVNEGITQSSLSTRNHDIVDIVEKDKVKEHREPPTSEFRLLSNLNSGTPSAPSGGNHLTLDNGRHSSEKSVITNMRGEPSVSSNAKDLSFGDSEMTQSPYQTSLLSNLRGGTPSTPSGGNHLILVNGKKDRAPPAPDAFLSPHPSLDDIEVGLTIQEDQEIRSTLLSASPSSSDTSPAELPMNPDFVSSIRKLLLWDASNSKSANVVDSRRQDIDCSDSTSGFYSMTDPFSSNSLRGMSALYRRN